MERWVLLRKGADFEAISKKFHISPRLASLIRNRDVIGDEAINQYLNGTIVELYDGMQMKGMPQAVEILTEKIRDREKIRVIGDYDCDGINATYILLEGLEKLGAKVDSDIPDRIKDGYGLNQHLIDRAYEDGIDTIITCDNGIAAVQEIAQAKALGMTVIVTDHHEPQEVLPPADALINPKQPDCPYPYKSLCGAAVAFKLIQCLYEAYGISAEEWDPLLENVAFATVGDVMDLTGENRILVKEGLKRLNHTRNEGFRALIAANGLTEGPISAYHIGFVLGPCINATGRLDTAKRALKLLMASTPEQAKILAEELKSLNDERKDMTQQGVAEAMELMESTSMKEDKVLVIYLPTCHESLAGIIAGRIREKYNRPVFVLTKAEEGVKGSGRSIEAYNMFQELCKVSGLFTKFGGHPMAAGLSLPEENVERFRKEINEAAELTEDDLLPKIMIDVPMPLDYIKEKLIRELSVLEPFGKANTKPVFADRNLKILRAQIIGRNRNVLKMLVQNASGCTMEALYFGDIPGFEDYIRENFGPAELELLLQGRPSSVVLSMTYYPSVNEFRGNKTLQIVIQNYQRGKGETSGKK